MTYNFDRLNEAGEEMTLQEVIYRSLGAASTCWDKQGVFDSSKAIEIGEAVIAWIKKNEKANLGLATTKDLLEELSCRMSFVEDPYAQRIIGVCQFALSSMDEEHLNYRTVDS